MNKENETVFFDKELARKKVETEYPELMKLNQAEINALIKREKSKNRKFLIKRNLVLELLALQSARKGEDSINKLLKTVEMKANYSLAKTSDYYHRVLKHRKDFKAITKKRNEIYRNKSLGIAHE